MTRAAPKPTAVPMSSGARLGTPHAIDATAHHSENAPRPTSTVRSPREGRRLQATATPARSRGKTQASGRKKAPLRMRAAHVMPAAIAPSALRRWRSAFLAYFDTGGASNGGTEAVNGLIELHRRIARGFRNRHNYRLRMLLIAGGITP